jgi:phage terminase large subunit
MTQRIDLPYQPTAYQQALHAALARHRFVVAACHRRFGKTVMAVNHIIFESLRHPGHSYAYCAPFRYQAKSVAWAVFKEYLAPVPGVTFMEAELVIKLPNGSTIRLMGVDNADGVRGMGFNGMVADEVTDMVSDAWTLVLRPTLSRTKG